MARIARHFLPFIVLAVFTCVGVSMAIGNTVYADDPDKRFDVNTFYCTTRYGLSIPGETVRREACQRGYDEKVCDATAGDDEDGAARACEEGRQAYHGLTPEPDVDANTLTATTATAPPPPRAVAQSGTKSCGDVDTAFLSCQVPAMLGVGGTGLGALLNIVINIMALGVGILALGVFVYAGVLYASSRDNQSQVKKAKDMIKNTVVGLIMFGAMYAVIQFIIPGGLF